MHRFKLFCFLALQPSLQLQTVLKTQLNYSWLCRLSVPVPPEKRCACVLSICFTSGCSSCWLMCPTHGHSSFSRKPISYRRPAAWSLQSHRVRSVALWSEVMEGREEKLVKNIIKGAAEKARSDMKTGQVQIKVWNGRDCLEVNGERWKRCKEVKTKIKDVDRWGWEVASPVPH